VGFKSHLLGLLLFFLCTPTHILCDSPLPAADFLLRRGMLLLFLRFSRILFELDDDVLVSIVWPAASKTQRTKHKKKPNRCFVAECPFFFLLALVLQRWQSLHENVYTHVALAATETHVFFTLRFIDFEFLFRLENWLLEF